MTEIGKRTMAMTHDEMIVEVFRQACHDALWAHRRDDAAAVKRYHEVCNALEVAYPSQVREATLATVGQHAAKED